MLFGLASDCCQRAQQLRRDSGVMAVLSRCDNNLIPVGEERDSSSLSAGETCRGSVEMHENFNLQWNKQLFNQCVST